MERGRGGRERNARREGERMRGNTEGEKKQEIEIKSDRKVNKQNGKQGIKDGEPKRRGVGGMRADSR